MNVLYIICFKTHLSKKLSHSSNARSPSPRSRLRLRLHTPPQRVVRRKAVRCRRSTIEANDRTIEGSNANDRSVGATSAQTARRLDEGDAGDGVGARGAKAASLGIIMFKENDDGQGTGKTTDTSGSSVDEWER
jgi:hypothetical protein